MSIRRARKVLRIEADAVRGLIPRVGRCCLMLKIVSSIVVGLIMLGPGVGFCDSSGSTPEAEHPNPQQSYATYKILRGCIPGLMRTPSSRDDQSAWLPGLKSMTQTRPNDPVPYAVLGMVYEELYWVFDAREAYEKAQGLNIHDEHPCGINLSATVQARLTRINELISKIEEKVGRLETGSASERMELAKKASHEADVHGDEWTIMFSAYVVHLIPDRREAAGAYAGMTGFGGQLTATRDRYRKAIELNDQIPDIYDEFACIYVVLNEVAPEVLQLPEWNLSQGKLLYERALQLYRSQGRERAAAELEAYAEKVFGPVSTNPVEGVNLKSNH